MKTFSPSEDLCEFLAANNPLLLVRWIKSEELPPSALTFAAEALGSVYENSERVRGALVPLLGHVSPIVREGAVYGLQKHLDPALRELLARMALEDPSKGVRTAAEDALAG